MALTNVKTADITLGNLKAKIYDLAFTSVTGGKLVTGMQNVLIAIYSPSTSEDAGIIYKNSASASETEDDFGDVYIDGVTSNDNGQIIVIGV